MTETSFIILYLASGSELAHCNGTERKKYTNGVYQIVVLVTFTVKQRSADTRAENYARGVEQRQPVVVVRVPHRHVKSQIVPALGTLCAWTRDDRQEHGVRVHAPTNVLTTGYCNKQLQINKGYVALSPAQHSGIHVLYLVAQT